MRQVPLEREINIAVNGPFLVEGVNKLEGNGPVEPAASRAI